MPEATTDAPKLHLENLAISIVFEAERKHLGISREMYMCRLLHMAVSNIALTQQLQSAQLDGVRQTMHQLSKQLKTPSEKRTARKIAQLSRKRGGDLR